MLELEARQGQPKNAANTVREDRSDPIVIAASSSSKSWPRLRTPTSTRREYHPRAVLVAIVLLTSSFARACLFQAFCPPRSPQVRPTPATRRRPPLQLGTAATMWDVLAPARYALEKSVAGLSIPNVSRIEDRRRLQDCLEGDDGETFDHSPWTAVLTRHVTTGATVGRIENVNVVDYASISRDDDFWGYLKALEQAQPERLSQREQLAFWMNAYNALCIATIVHYETTTRRRLESITQLSTAEKGPVWDQKVPNCRIGGKDITLNDIEHVHLRAVWAEPAVHACIVCASASCPNLRAEAFAADRLVPQMNDQMRDWVSNPTKGLRLVVPAAAAASSSSRRNRLELSRIFLWFADDFGGIRGLKEWLPQFIDDPQASDEAIASASVRYFEYDWHINRAPAPASSAATSVATSRS